MVRMTMRNPCFNPRHGRPASRAFTRSLRAVRFKTRPATASSLAQQCRIALVRRGDEGRVQHVFPRPADDGLRSGPSLGATRMTSRRALSALSRHHLDHLHRRSRVRGRDASNHNPSPWRRWRKAAPLRARAWLPASPSCRSRATPGAIEIGFRRRWRIADLPWQI